MKKEEILKNLLELHKLFETDRDEIAKKYNMERKDVYPFLAGYVSNDIKYILENCNMLEKGENK